MTVAIRRRTVRVNDLEFGLLEAGSGPLALCLHGFPDCAHTWRHLLPALADNSFHAVAPFMRGYAPTQIPASGDYWLNTLAADANGLHEVLEGGPDAVLIGNDWGAEAAYLAAAAAPDRWRRLATIAVPPASMDSVLFADFEQLKRFWYIFLFRDPDDFAAGLVGKDDLAFVDKLWRAWSPVFDSAGHLELVKESLRAPENLAAAIGYYRAVTDGGPSRVAPQPTLYLHGTADGCISAELVTDVADFLAPSSRAVFVDGAGHFPQLEKPSEVNRHIIEWFAS